MRVDVRRVQKVGTSSLVVTIPKQWAQKLGIEQGSQVMLVDEGDSIRIIPVDKRSMPGVEIDLSRAPPMLALNAPVCLYLSGAEKARLRLPSQDIVEELRLRAMGFMGVQVFEAGEREVEIEVLIDSERINIVTLIKSLGGIAQRLVRILEAVLEGRAEEAGKADFVRQDFMRTLYVILRCLLSRKIHRDNAIVVQRSLAASYVSLAFEIIYQVIRDVAGRGLDEGDSSLVRRVIGPADGGADLREDVILLLHLIAEPSAKRLIPLIGRLRRREELAGSLVEEAGSPRAGLVLGRLADAIQMLLLASYVVVCSLVLQHASPGG